MLQTELDFSLEARIGAPGVTKSADKKEKSQRGVAARCLPLMIAWVFTAWASVAANHDNVGDALSAGEATMPGSFFRR